MVKEILPRMTWERPGSAGDHAGILNNNAGKARIFFKNAGVTPTYPGMPAVTERSNIKKMNFMLKEFSTRTISTPNNQKLGKAESGGGNSFLSALAPYRPNGSVCGAYLFRPKWFGSRGDYRTGRNGSVCGDNPYQAEMVWSRREYPTSRNGSVCGTQVYSTIHGGMNHGIF